MAKTKILYFGTEATGTQDNKLSMYCNSTNEIFISIDSEVNKHSFICLDRSTAIKLCKELRKEISNLIVE